MHLTERQRKHLRGLAHALKPTVLIGASGLSDAVLTEVDKTLQHHELIKIRVRVGNRRLRDTTIEELSRITGADIIQKIGNAVALYRPRLEGSAIKLP